MYHHGWAWAGDAPFKSTKLVAAHFGGTRTPLVVSWPARITPDGRVRTQFHHLNDVAATLYEVVGIDPPHTVDGVEQDPLDGVSFAYTFDDAEATGRKRTQYFDIYASRGIYQDGWFACTFGPRQPWRRMSAGLRDWDPDNDVWELYDLRTDFSQAHDLAAQRPDELRALQDRFVMEATENKVFPIGAAFYTSALHMEELRASTLTEWRLYPGQTRIPESCAPKYTGGHSSVATVDVDLPDAASGVLFCVGGLAGGFTVYLRDGELRAEYNTLGVYRFRAGSAGAIPTGKQRIEVRLAFDEPTPRSPATLTLSVGGAEVGSCRVERPVPAGFTASETFDVGCDLGSPVSLDYHGPARFTGTIDRVHIRYV
jgi:arylsulfatase